MTLPFASFTRMAKLEELEVAVVSTASDWLISVIPFGVLPMLKEPRIINKNLMTMVNDGYR